MLGLALREIRMREGGWSQSLEIQYRSLGTQRRALVPYSPFQHEAVIVPSTSRMLARDARHLHYQCLQTPVPF